MLRNLMSFFIKKKVFSLNSPIKFLAILYPNQITGEPSGWKWELGIVIRFYCDPVDFLPDAYNRHYTP